MIIPIIDDPMRTQAWTCLVPTIGVTTFGCPSSIGSYIYTLGGGCTVRAQQTASQTRHLIPLVTWRPGVEQVVLKNARLNRIVIRPCCIEGASLRRIRHPIGGRQVVRHGKRRRRLSLIHTDNIADLHVRAFERTRRFSAGWKKDARTYTTETSKGLLQGSIQASDAQRSSGWITDKGICHNAHSPVSTPRTASRMKGHGFFAILIKV
ncbi:hypothetical protein L210DRAFT_3535528 [Boletus edulis BED1]|uniref:Uncharacterized protein n=1 Tax=Boletus edulis BED1 TaxID=1328754 RepID=A0AAD4GGG5_BOLED|nr:hypothetical protein L210DRAFT_3535528 [Boletus edulis BED1]